MAPLGLPAEPADAVVVPQLAVPLAQTMVVPPAARIPFTEVAPVVPTELTTTLSGVVKVKVRAVESLAVLQALRKLATLLIVPLVGAVCPVRPLIMQP